MSAQGVNQFDKNGKRHGLWQKNYENTNVLRYRGNFSHGKEVGEFKFYINSKGKPILSATKVFKPENSISQVTFFSSKGKVISEGKMDGKKHIGIWKYYQKSSDELLILEEFNDLGVLDGERQVFYANGQVAEKANYSQGMLDGLSTWYSEHGVLIKELRYVDNQLEGDTKVYNGKGELIIEGQYKKGQKSGIWNYFEAGNLTEQKNFSR